MRFWATDGKAEPTAQRTRTLRQMRRTDVSAQLVSAFAESSIGWFWMTDRDGYLTYLSGSIADQFLDRDNSSGAALYDLFEADGAQEDPSSTLRFSLAKQKKFKRHLVRAVASGSDKLWSMSGVPQHDQSGRFSGFCGTAIDVTEQVQATRATSRLAMHDPLTGLPNRTKMRQVLEAEIEGTRATNRRCAVLTIDLDRFKPINDTLGHPVGDILLKAVSGRILECLQVKEHAFRVGGDEFQVIERGDCSKEALRSLGQRLVERLSQPYLLEETKCSIGASVGVAISPNDGGTVDEIIRNADLALYAAKGEGRGRVSFFSEELLKAAENRRVLEDDLREALARSEIEVYYQPVVAARSDTMSCVEALVRWCHPEYGYVSPAEFIPIAEDANLIGPLGEWVLRKACADAAGWGGQVRVAVNVSPLQFDESLVGKVDSALTSSGLPPERLELEITEGVFLDSSSSSDGVFESLKQIGIRLALDDFGTGYSSLGYLKTAPFDKIKIDQTFIRAATLPGSRNRAIISAIVALAQAMQMETTAEGVESLDQLDLVRNLGVSHVQGYIYSKPLSCEELSERIASGALTIKPDGPSKQRSDRVSMYRKVRAIFGNHCREMLIRNLSASGALVEGLDDVQPGSHLIVDFGEGFLAFAKVVRVRNRQQGLEFEDPLVADGMGGFRPATAVSQYALQTANLPRTVSTEDVPQPVQDNDVILNKIGEGLKISRSRTNSSAECEKENNGSRTSRGRTGRLPSIRELINEAGMADYSQDEQELIFDHILPVFGHRCPDTISPSQIGDWLSEKSEKMDTVCVRRLRDLMVQVQTNAIEIRLNGELPTNVAKLNGGSGRNVHERPLTAVEIVRLKEAVEASPNAQLKHVIALIMHTRVRERDILQATWTQFDLDKGLWTIPTLTGEKGREIVISPQASEAIDSFPRFENCAYVLPNPVTLKPYRSVASSWDTARRKAGLPDVEIEDLRFCDLDEAVASSCESKPMSSTVDRFVNLRSASLP